MKTQKVKFRAFDTKEKRMYHAHDFPDRYLMMLDCTIFDLKAKDTFGLGLGAPVEEGRFILSQFTGKKDSYGNDVYEGDIYEYDYEYDSDYDGDMPIVKRAQGKATVNYLTDTYSLDQAKSEGGKCRVIENIYELGEKIEPTKP